MDQILRAHADAIAAAAIRAVQPDDAVRRALEGQEFPGRVVLVAAGKAAWQMAKAAYDCLGSRIDRGVVVTKYGHALGRIGTLTIREAGHPVPDENSFAGTQLALELVAGLAPGDTVLFLLSGGGSALFEKPLVSGAELGEITEQLLACGADIVEINTIRKRLSAVKGSVGYSGRPAGHDRLRPRRGGYQHLRPGVGHCGKIPAPAVRPGMGAAEDGNAERPEKCHHPDHRLRPGALRRCRRSLPGNGL